VSLSLRPVAGLLTLSSLALIVLIGLGTWQLQRLAEKEALIVRVDRLVKSPPQPLPNPATWRNLDPAAIAYQPLTLSCVFDHAREIHVFISLESPKGSRKGPGYFVMTPLALSDGHIVWINRGFVPEGSKNPATRAAGQVSGAQDISGLMRPAEKPSWLSPAADVVKNVWFVRDPAEMARTAGLDVAKVAPFTVDAFASPIPGGLPQGGETIISFPNNHLGYAITWYGLAAALVAVTIRLARQRLKTAAA
jgi:surfeit locus 1 family protein